MPVVSIYGVDVVEHSRYKGCTIYKGTSEQRWFADYSDGSGWRRTVENGSLADLKTDINYLVRTGQVKR